MKMSMKWSKDEKYLELCIETRLPNICNLLSETSTILGRSDKDYIELQWAKRTVEARNRVTEFLCSYSPNKIGDCRCVLKFNSRYRASRKRRLSIPAIIKGIYYCDVDFGQKIPDKEIWWVTKFGTPKENPEEFVREIAKGMLETNILSVSRPLAAAALWHLVNKPGPKKKEDRH